MIDNLNEEYYEKHDIDQDIVQSDEIERNYALLKKYMKEIKRKRYMSVFSVNGDASKQMTKELKDWFLNRGFSKNVLEDEDYSFIGIVDHGGCVEEAEGEENQSMDMWLDDVHVIVESNGNLAEGDPYSRISINGNEYSKNVEGLNIVVYDRKMAKVISSVGFALSGNYGITYP